ncbi:hypothetical protein GT037_000926 [Alternaria burnsii]|uniref:Uncharacterized protein n=1 Tax=Alternaria burnsii TaxID=1187904 RepID=A0A8H7BCU6_9PLEO|nr:uncharacterized protein GT037_000926 [Alternaria burnsii]KAF7681950.1 hypothetical protein GT037_000926 [Alternaria burnsii]
MTTALQVACGSRLRFLNLGTEGIPLAARNAVSVYESCEEFRTWAADAVSEFCAVVSLPRHHRRRSHSPS